MAQYLGFCGLFAFDCFMISRDPSLYQFLHPPKWSFFFLFSCFFMSHRQRSETQVVMQLGIDGFQLGFLLFFLVTFYKFCWDWAILTWGNEMNFTGWEGSSPLFVACYVLCSAFHLFYYFFHGVFFFSIQKAHTRKKKVFIHIYPALLIVGSFMVHDVCFFFFCIMNGQLGGFLFFLLPFSFP